MVIKFFFKDGAIRIQQRKKLKRFITGLFHAEGKVCSSLTYVFCSDASLLAINEEFLNHTDLTDVITFCLSNPSLPITGEVYISGDRIRDNAAKYRVSAEAELYRVMFHGALHLCGYKDKSPLEKRGMTLVENIYLKLYARFEL